MNPEVRKLIVRGTMFVLLFPLGYAATYACLHGVHRWVDGPPPDAICLWGDSRTVTGIDAERLSALTARPVRTWAVAGGGPYDLLVFAREVPAGSDVIVGVSLPMLLRGSDLDRNRAGFSLRALVIAARHGYPAMTLWNIARNNRDPLHTEMRSAGRSFATAPDPRMDAFELYRERFAVAEPPALYFNKLAVYREGIEILRRNGCRVTIVDFPVYGVSAEMQKNSVYADFPRVLQDLADDRVRILEDIVLPAKPGENLMYDLSHLNERGRELMTEYLYRAMFEPL